MLPSGMFMLPSKFGFMVTGKCSVTDDSKSDNPSLVHCSCRILKERSDYQAQGSVNVSITNNPDLENFWH